MTLATIFPLFASASMAVQIPAAPTCPPVIAPPTTISDEAREALSLDADQRFMRSDPASEEDWIALQESSKKAGARWIAALVAEHGLGVDWQTLGGVPAAWVHPDGTAPGPDDTIIFNLHGGGYALNGGDAALYTAASFAQLEGMSSVTIDYRLTPQHPWPAALDDAVAAYRALIRDRSPETIAVYGLSAGGGLGAAFLLKLRDEGLPLPRAAVLNSPWSDVTLASDTVQTLDCEDIRLGRSQASLRQLARFYARGSNAADPLIAPGFGDWSGIDTPTLLVSGTRDAMLSDTVRLHRAMWRAGVPTQLIVHEGMWHAFSVKPEFEAMIADTVRFFREPDHRPETDG